MEVDTDQVVREVLNLTPLLRRRILRPVDTCIAGRVSTNQISILTALQENGPQTMHKLSDQIIVCRQQMTQLIGELERKGFVRRKTGKIDRRTITIELTDYGLQYLDDVQARMRQELYPIFDGYTDARKADLILATRAMKRIIEG